MSLELVLQVKYERTTSGINLIRERDIGIGKIDSRVLPVFIHIITEVKLPRVANNSKSGCRLCRGVHIANGLDVVYWSVQVYLDIIRARHFAMGLFSYKSNVVCVSLCLEIFRRCRYRNSVAVYATWGANRLRSAVSKVNLDVL